MRVFYQSRHVILLIIQEGHVQPLVDVLGIEPRCWILANRNPLACHTRGGHNRLEHSQYASERVFPANRAGGGGQFYILPRIVHIRTEVHRS